MGRQHRYRGAGRHACGLAAPRCQRRIPRRHATGLGRLLEGIGEAQQHRLAPGAAGKGRSERIFGAPVARAGDHSGRHLHAGIAGLGRDGGAVAAGKQDGIELVAVQIGIEPERAGGKDVHLPRRDVFDLAEIAPRRLRGDEDVLAEAQGAPGIGVVEGDDIGHRPHLGALGPVAEIGVEVVLELVEVDDRAQLRLVEGPAFRIAVENGGLGAGSAHPADGGNVGAHEDGAGALPARRWHCA